MQYRLLFCVFLLFSCKANLKNNEALKKYETHIENLKSFHKATIENKSTAAEVTFILDSINQSFKEISNLEFQQRLQVIIEKDVEFKKNIRSLQTDAQKNMKLILPAIMKTAKRFKSDSSVYQALKRIRDSLYLITIE